MGANHLLTYWDYKNTTSFDSKTTLLTKNYLETSSKSGEQGNFWTKQSTYVPIFNKQMSLKMRFESCFRNSDHQVSQISRAIVFPIRSEH
jgi:hypothetical protein